jgi:hypothetical protein
MRAGGSRSRFARPSSPGHGSQAAENSARGPRTNRRGTQDCILGNSRPSLRDRVIARSKVWDGCPRFAKAYLGRKRRAKPTIVFTLSPASPGRGLEKAFETYHFRPRYPDFLHGAPPTTARAAFLKESRMKCANANKLNRKSGVRSGEPGAPVLFLLGPPTTQTPSGLNCRWRSHAYSKQLAKKLMFCIRARLQPCPSPNGAAPPVLQGSWRLILEKLREGLSEG